MTHASVVVRHLSRRIIDYKSLARAFSALSTERRMYISHKLTRVVPNLQRAIAKALQGTRSTCDDCEDAIGNARLKAVPGAIRCLGCQERAEKVLR